MAKELQQAREPRQRTPMGFLKDHTIALVLMVTLISVSVFLSIYTTPEEVIDWVGVENAYLLMTFLGFLSGAMTMSGIPYHLVLIEFSTGGLNPFGLALVTTTGLMLGDSISYFLGYHSHAAIPEKIRGLLVWIRTFGERHPRIMPLIFFTYASVVPFSNDLVGMTMGLARYSFLRVMIPLALGTLVFNSVVAYFGASVYELILGST